jgi:hypothetical protein
MSFSFCIINISNISFNAYLNILDTFKFRRYILILTSHHSTKDPLHALHPCLSSLWVIPTLARLTHKKQPATPSLCSNPPKRTEQHNKYRQYSRTCRIQQEIQRILVRTRLTTTLIPTCNVLFLLKNTRIKHIFKK